MKVWIMKPNPQTYKFWHLRVTDVLTSRDCVIAKIQDPVDQIVIHETTLAQPQLYLDVDDILKKHKRSYRFVFFDESSMHDFFEAYVSAFEKNTNILSHKTFVALGCEGGG